MTRHSVVIAGGGPTGLMLAGELALAGVDVVIVERRPNQDLAGSRAGGLQSRTVEILDQRGIADRSLAEGQVAQVAGFASVRLDISDFPTTHNYGLGLLDTYEAERHPVAARVLRNTMAQTALMRADDRIDALRETVSELLAMDEPRRRFAAMMSGLE